MENDSRRSFDLEAAALAICRAALLINFEQSEITFEQQ